MKKIGFFICILCAIGIFLTCKKKTTIKVRVFNAPLNENVANAKVVLVQKKGEAQGGLFVSSANCEEIATAVTDANGVCVFDQENLRSNNKYKYFCAVTESWGITQGYPCAGIASNFIEKGNNQDWLLTDLQNGKLSVMYNNLLNPSQPGDSLCVSIEFLKYLDPFDERTKGGGRVFIGFPSYGSNGFPFPSKIVTAPETCAGGKYVATLFKKKMGVITTTTDSLKIYPNQIKTYTINW